MRALIFLPFLLACGGGSGGGVVLEPERLTAFSVETRDDGWVYCPAFEWYGDRLVDERGVEVVGSAAASAYAYRAQVIAEWEAAGAEVHYWLEEEWLVNADLSYRVGFALRVLDWGSLEVVDRAVWLVAGG